MASAGVISIGTCETCKRQGVKVRATVSSPWADHPHLVCTDLPACYEAWLALETEGDTA